MATSDNFTAFECIAFKLGSLEQSLDTVEFQNTIIIEKGACVTTVNRGSSSFRLPTPLLVWGQCGMCCCVVERCRYSLYLFGWPEISAGRRWSLAWPFLICNLWVHCVLYCC